MVKNTGTQGRSTMAIGPAPVIKPRIASRSRTGWGPSPGCRLVTVRRITAPCTAIARRWSRTAADRTTTRERIKSRTPWKA